MSNARVAEAWKHYPLHTKLQGKPFTLRPMTVDDGAALRAFALELPPHDLLFMRRDITKPEGINRWVDAVRRGDKQRAREQFQLAQARCPTVSEFNWAASSELKRL